MRKYVMRRRVVLFDCHDQLPSPVRHLVSSCIAARPHCLEQVEQVVNGYVVIVVVLNDENGESKVACC